MLCSLPSTLKGEGAERVILLLVQLEAIARSKRTVLLKFMLVALSRKPRNKMVTLFNATSLTGCQIAGWRKWTRLQAISAAQ